MLNFLRNGQNKVKCYFNLLKMLSLRRKRSRMIQRCITLKNLINNKSWCTKITSENVSRIDSYASDHEEADTKLIALVSYNTVLVRSPSGDIDILVLFFPHQFENKRVLIDNGTGNNRKIIDMNSTTLTQLQRQALAGMHAFSGNDICFGLFQERETAVLEFGYKKRRVYSNFYYLRIVQSMPQTKQGTSRIMFV